MKRYLSLLLAAFAFLSGCAVKDGGAPQTVKETPADVRPLDDGPKLLTEDGGQDGKAQEDA